MKEKIFYLDKNGFDFLIKSKTTWYGVHWFWQSIPFFGIIKSHRELNTIHKYGFIIFGFNLYIKIDQYYFDDNPGNCKKCTNSKDDYAKEECDFWYNNSY